MARPTHRSGNLPAEVTSFIGRRRELAEVRSKLTQARLVSLVGLGGVGKTRVALRAAAGLGRGFRDGAWLAKLADLRDPSLVTAAVASALDLRDQAATDPRALVLSYLRDKALLLVVDNCEHLLPASAAFVSEVISASPDVRIIATSREPLSVPGEHVVPIPPLELPAPPGEQSGPGELRHNAAVRLFAERAAAAAGTFELAYGWACFVRGFLAVLKNDPPAAQLWLRNAISTARGTGQRELLTEALAMASSQKTAPAITAVRGHFSTKHERPRPRSITRPACSQYCKPRHCMGSPKATRGRREPRPKRARIWPGRLAICTR